MAGLASLVEGAATPKEFKVEPLYTLIFWRLLPADPKPAEALKQMGLPESYTRYMGTHAYSPEAPLMNLKWRVTFLQQVGFRGIVNYYVRNPRLLWRQIHIGLRLELPVIRPDNLGNYTRESGLPPGTLARRHVFWSDLRGWLLRLFPLHVMIFYLLVAVLR